MNRKKNARFLVLLATMVLCTHAFSQNKNFHIYLCFGQSNMEGQGLIEKQDKTVDSRFKVLQALDCSNKNRVKGSWYTAVPPLCQCYSKLSLADYFGRTMVANLPDSITVGIVNVAIGGCDIRLFDKDMYQDYDSTHIEDWFSQKIKDYNGNPYQYLIDLAQQAQQDGVIKGILLHQGETNNGDAQWPSYVKKIYNDMLADLSLGADTVPLLAGEVVGSDQRGICAGMNTIIARLPDTIPTSYVIPSKGCTDRSDNVHFNSAGCRKLGRRYAVQMLSLMGYEAAYAEAECGTAGENMRVLADAEASTGSYITVIPEIEAITAAPDDDKNATVMNVHLAKDTSYHIYGRFSNLSATDLVWMKIDDGAFEAIDAQAVPTWQWIALKSTNLAEGDHTISIALSKEGIAFDKIAVKNSEIAPVGIGEEDANVCVPNVYSEDTTAQTAVEHHLAGYLLGQNSPNPFRGSSIISFEIPTAQFVSLKVFDAQGAEIAELAGKEYNAGKYAIEFGTSALPAGNYYYTINAGAFSATKAMAIKP